MSLQYSWIIELGVLLVIFALVFMMGFAVCQISREFSHTDIYRLNLLVDWDRNGKEWRKTRRWRDGSRFVFLFRLCRLASYLLRRRRVLTALLLFTALFHSAATLCPVLLPGALRRKYLACVDDIGVWALAVTLYFVFLCFVSHGDGLPEEERYALRARRGVVASARVPALHGVVFGDDELDCAVTEPALMWLAIDTTLVSAPLILFRRSKASLEAMWKYLLICSVGVGLAMFGTLLVAMSARGTGCDGLGFAELLLCSEGLEPGWFLAAFIFILVGYGTKMGLAPFHTWLPDTLAEAPGVVSALLSGALLNCRS